MAEPGQQACYFARRCRDFRIDGVAIRRYVREGDAQTTRIASDFLREWPLRRRREIEALRFGSVERGQHGGTVAHADAHDMAAGKTGPPFAAARPDRMGPP